MTAGTALPRGLPPAWTLALDGNPLADITNTRRIARVMQDGVWVDRSAMLPDR